MKVVKFSLCIVGIALARDIAPPTDGWFKKSNETFKGIAKECSRDLTKGVIKTSMTYGPIIIFLILASIFYQRHLKNQMQDKEFNEDVDCLCLKKDEEDQIQKLIDRAKKLNKPQTLMLYGPSGTGKSLVPDKIAKDTGFKVLRISAADMKGIYIGQSAKNIQNIFAKASEMAATTGCVLFIDEVDCIATPRSFDGSNWSKEEASTTGQFFQELDAVLKKDIKNMIVVCATNAEQGDIDSAFRRRFRTKIQMTLPNDDAIKKILETYLKKYRCNKESVELFQESEISSAVDSISQKLSGTNISGAEIRDIVNIAIENLESKEPGSNLILLQLLEKSADDILNERSKVSRNKSNPESGAQGHNSLLQALRAG